MKFLFRGVLLFAVVIGFLFGAFSLYAHFLMDYSLDNLTIVASAAKENAHSDEKLSNASQNVYLGIVQGVAIEEASKDDLDMQSLTLLDLASRSLDEAQYRTGYVRANNYLNTMIHSKRPKKFFLIRVVDDLTRGFLSSAKAIKSFIVYLVTRKDNSSETEEKITFEDYASALLLNQAQEKEQSGLFYQAEERYRKYIEIYKTSKNRPMAIISLANVLIRERKFQEASRFLHEMRADLSSTAEGEIADKLLRRIDTIGDKLKLIIKLKRQVLKEPDVMRRQAAFLKLGINYVATYQLEKAETVFLKLKNSEDVDVRQKAGFYLGWIYKNNMDYEKSVQMFKFLLEDPSISEDSQYALRAQLADVYYKKGDARRSAELYKSISTMASSSPGDIQSKLRSHESVWASFSESELVNIYSFDLNDPREARQHMDKLMDLSESSDSAQALSLTLEWAGKVSLRDLAFQALVDKRLTKALDLFTKYLSQHEDDSLTLTGLATVYALMGDLEGAYTYALKGYERQPSEYSILMLGYIEGLRGNYAKSIEKYREALALKPDSNPAKFNLAYSHLKIEQFQVSLDIMLPLEVALRELPKEKFLLAKTLNNIGYCYWGMGQTPKDIEYFNKALDVNPGFDTAKRNMIELKRRAVPKPARLLD